MMIYRFTCVLTVLTFLPGVVGVTRGQVIFQDDFTGSSLDMSQWQLPDPGDASFLGRTQLRLSTSPAVDNGVAHLRLDTYNGPDGTSFLGSEIQTRQKFELGGGLAFQTRSRLVNPPGGPPGGVVGSLFTYQYHDGVRDEIDVELLGNEVKNGQQRLNTNAFDDDGFNTGGDAAMVHAPNLDLSQFNTYRVEWRPDRVEWFVNGTLVRTENSTVPDATTDVRLNFWAPASDFAAAYDGTLQPVSSQTQNQTFYYDVDSVKVERLAPLFRDGLRDGGFEQGQDVWRFTGNSYVENKPALTPGTGQSSLKQFGTFAPGPETDAVQDSILAIPGQTYQLSAYVFTDSNDSIAGTSNREKMVINFFDNAGTLIDGASVEQVIADGSMAEDQSLYRALQAIAPLNAKTLSVSFIFDQPGSDAGSVFVDDITLARVPQPTSFALLGMGGLLLLGRRRYPVSRA